MSTKTKSILKQNRCRSLILTILVVASSIISLISATPSFAATPNFDLLEGPVTPEMQANSASYYAVLSGCFDWAIPTNGRIDASSTKNPSPAGWFSRDGGSHNMAYLDGKTTSCSEVAIKAVTLWGWVYGEGDQKGKPDYASFLVAAGCGYDTDGRYYGCNAKGETRAGNFKRAVREKAYANASLSDLKSIDDRGDYIDVSYASSYIRNYKTFFNQCIPTKIDVASILAADPLSEIQNKISRGYYEPTDANYSSTTVYTTVNVATSTDTIDKNGVVTSRVTAVTPTSFKYITQMGFIDGSGNLTYNSYDSDFGYDGTEDSVSTFGHANKNGTDYSEGKSTCAGMINAMNSNGAAEAYNAYYVANLSVSPTDTLQIQEEVEQQATATGKTCGIDGIGWIVCPVLNFMAKIADDAFVFLSDNFLSTSTNIFTGDTIFQAWSSIRSIANVAFVIVFLIIIFSQLTSFGIDNYGIKKLLPKLVIAAVLVNLSYYICQIAVDLSNILGYSLENFFVGLAPSASTFAQTKTGFVGILSGIVMVTAGAAIAWASLAAIIPAIIAAVVALIMILFILIGRQALIIILIIISPLAFVAFLLPNTEKLYQKWQKSFVSMLMLFPIVATIFGASKLASGILSSVFGATDNTMGQIAAAVVMVLPLFVVPGLLKKAIDGFGNIGQTMNKLGDKIGGVAGKKVGEKFENSDFNRTRQTKKKAVADYKGRRYAERVQDGTSLGAKLAAAGITKKAKYAQDRISNSAVAAVEDAEQNDIKQSRVGLNRIIQAAKLTNPDVDTDDLLEKRAQNNSLSAIDRTAAMHELAAQGRDKIIRRLMSNPAVDQSALRKSIMLNAGSLAAKAPDLVKSRSAAFGTVTGQDLAGFSKSTGESYMKYLHELSTDPGKATEYNDAKTAFNSAIESIASDPNLASKFDNDTGKNILQTLRNIGTTPGIVGGSAFVADLSTTVTNLGRINSSDGKIR